MSEQDPPWKRLVDELKARRHHSPSLDRLSQRLQIAAGRQSLEQEMLAEMAGALRRASDKVDVALLRLELAGLQLDEAAPADRPARIAAFNELRDAALRARWELQVHRESLGLPGSRTIETDYPVPPRKRE